MTKEIGSKLKQLRQSKKLTQEEVAARVNITRSTVSNYERGRRTPHLKDLQKLADVFSVGLDYFGVSPKDEAFELLARAKQVFANDLISAEEKEELYMEFMRLYITLKEGK